MERRGVKFNLCYQHCYDKHSSITEWSELLNHATNLLRHRIRSYTTGFLELGCGLEA